MPWTCQRSPAACEHDRHLTRTGACSGSFKFRGALNALSELDAKQAEKGVVVHSSGNHAGAVALAAKIFEIPAYIVLPTDAPQVERPFTRSCWLVISAQCC